MMPRLAPLALCGALLLAACTPPGNPSPDNDASNRWLAMARADTAAAPDSLGAWITRGCKRMARVDRECVERSLYGVLDRSGVAKAMAALDVMAETNEQMRGESHPLAHGLGIAAYKSPETLATTFAACPNSQISGCYHGVLQGYFLDVRQSGVEMTPGQLNGVCAVHLGKGNLWGQCVHGLGHGLMALLDNQLPSVLERCDQLTNPGAREGCYGGAFMENIVAETHPEHTAASHARMSAARPGTAQGEHAGMDHAAGHEGMDHGAMAGMDHSTMNHAGTSHGAPATPWKRLDANDPLYPCTAVAERYHYQCYLIQTSAILAQVSGDIPRTAQACARAPENMVHVCYVSLGRDLTAFASRDPQRTSDLCQRAGDAAVPGCIRGAAVALVEVNQKPDDGLALCRLAPEASRAGCYAGVAGTLPTNTPDPARREALCASFDVAYQDTCRLNARLTAPARRTR